MIDKKDIKIFIDYPSDIFWEDRLFDQQSKYNTENQLAIYVYLKKYLNDKGYEIHTADYLLRNKIISKYNIYISITNIHNYPKLAKRPDNIVFSSFFIFEPPVVSPEVYKEIPKLSKYFSKIFMHTKDDILEIFTKNIKNTYKFYWPQAESDLIEKYWDNKKRKFLALINANKKPRENWNELYSERINAIEHFSKKQKIDLYGRGWDRFLFYMPYIINKKNIEKCYRGSVKLKYETLSNYKFAICFENMVLNGYVTEKIFDCFFVGTIPVYWGAPDIEKYVPKNCFIDFRDFKNYTELEMYLESLKDRDINLFRNNIENYIKSEKYKQFTKEYFAEMIFDNIQEDIKTNLSQKANTNFNMHKYGGL